MPASEAEDEARADPEAEPTSDAEGETLAADKDGCSV